MTQPLTRSSIAAGTASLPMRADPRDAQELLALLRLLYAVGRSDLPRGRLFEGHVDAIQIIDRYGTEAQKAALSQALDSGGAFGVWNADAPGEPLAWQDGRLSGGKAFASGAGLLSHALVTVDIEGGRQLVLVDLSACPPQIDRSWWRVIGMQRSETHLVRWDDAALSPDAIVGSPGDYIREPWFSGGAIRFAAVQAGGIAALVDGVRDHLDAQERAGDPNQRGRLADLYLAAQAAADAVARAARQWHAGDIDHTLAHVAAARVAVYEAGERALTLAQAAVGAQAMFEAHPLSSAITDLMVYLRQPGPDQQRMMVGTAVAEAALVPRL
jgi:alkylation response protein AidB-like acyl-CoA dehydrogenase